MNITSESFINFLQSLLNRHIEIRKGQHLFNMISIYNPKLAELIISTDIDPFHDDSKIEECLKFIIKNWAAYDN